MIPTQQDELSVVVKTSIDWVSSELWQSTHPDREGWFHSFPYGACIRSACIGSQDVGFQWRNAAPTRSAPPSYLLRSGFTRVH